MGDVIVLDIGGTKVRVGHLQNGCICEEDETFSSQRLNVPAAYGVLADRIEDYARAHVLTPTAIVLGIPGVIDHERDSLSLVNNIPQLEGSGLRTLLETRFACQVVLEQDIMLQLLGEWYGGAAQGSPAVFGLYFGTGIGAAYLQNGDPRRRGAACLQVGHIPVWGTGKRCVCGNTDCAEAHACGHTLTELASATGISVDQLFLNRERTELKNALDTFIRLEAHVIATVVTITEPDTVVIGGGIPEMAGYPRAELFSRVRHHLQKPYPADTVKLRWAGLGRKAPLYGALAHLKQGTG